MVVCQRERPSRERAQPAAGFWDGFRVRVCIWLALHLEQARHEDVWHLLAVSHPIIAVLRGASLHVASDPMHQHTQEEERVKEWNRRPETTDESPAQTHGEIGGVMNLARHTPESSSEQGTSMLGRNVRGVLQEATGELGEGPAVQQSLSLSLTEVTLLSLSAIPHWKNRRRCKRAQSTRNQRNNSHRNSAV